MEKDTATKRPVQLCNVVLAFGFNVLLILFLVSCLTMKPSKLGVFDGELAPCPNSPNCVSSDARNGDHRVQPFRLKTEPHVAWQLLQAAVSSLKRTRIVTVTENYLHAESMSLIFRFVDDVEFSLRPDDNIIAVRSASRVGYSDLGANRRRVEQIRTYLQERGAIE